MFVFFRMDVLCMFCRSQYYLNSCIISYSNRYNYVWQFELKDFKLKYWWMSVFLEYISVGNRIFVSSVVVFRKTFTFLYQNIHFFVSFHRKLHFILYSTITDPLVLRSSPSFLVFCGMNQLSSLLYFQSSTLMDGFMLIAWMIESCDPEIFNLPGVIVKNASEMHSLVGKFCYWVFKNFFTPWIVKCQDVFNTWLIFSYVFLLMNTCSRPWFYTCVST